MGKEVGLTAHLLRLRGDDGNRFPIGRSGGAMNGNSSSFECPLDNLLNTHAGDPGAGYPS